MVRGTTAQFKFSLPYNYEDISIVKVVFWQPGNNGTTTAPMPIYKTLSSQDIKECCDPSRPKELVITLSQSETLRFSDKVKAYVQLSATCGTIRFASKQEMITVYPIYDDSILGDDITPTPGGGSDDEWIALDGEAIL